MTFKGARRPHTDVLVGIVVVVFSTLVYAATYRLDEVSAVISLGMGAEAFPRLVAAVMAFLGILLAWQARRRAPDAPEAVPPMVIYTAVLLGGFMLLTAITGMIVAMFMLVAAMGRMWGERRMLRLCTAAMLVCLGIWGIFVRGFGIPLPGGLASRLMF